MTTIVPVTSAQGADFSVHVVKSPAIADLLVYRDDASTPGLHNEAVWKFVDRRTPSVKAVHFTDLPSHALLKICYVAQRSLAGWLKHHKLKGRL